MLQNSLQELLSKVCLRIVNIVGTELSEIILSGSYARGTFDAESDIDIAVLINDARENLKKYRKGIISIMSELSLEYDTLISITCIPAAEFIEYKDILPYYRNINNEGIRIDAGECNGNL